MAYNPEYFQNNKERYAAYGTRYRDQLKAEMVEAYGGACVECGEDDEACLCLDHINDDSHVEKDLYGANARGGHKQYARLKAQGWPKDRFQLMCFNCNAKKENRRRRESTAKIQPADRTLAQAKVGRQPNNTSGFKGVFWSSQKNKWTARIMSDYKNRHLGFFDNIADAARAYKAAALEQWGDVANVPTEEEIEQIASQHRIQVATISLEGTGL